MNCGAPMETNEQLAEKIVQLETKLSYLEDFVNQLQGVLVEHTNQIDSLVAKNKILQERIAELQEDGYIPNVKPPHY